MGGRQNQDLSSTLVPVLTVWQISVTQVWQQLCTVLHGSKRRNITKQIQSESIETTQLPDSRMAWEPQQEGLAQLAALLSEFQKPGSNQAQVRIIGPAFTRLPTL